MKAGKVGYTANTMYLPAYEGVLLCLIFYLFSVFVRKCLLLQHMCILTRVHLALHRIVSSRRWRSVSKRNINKGVWDYGKPHLHSLMMRVRVLHSCSMQI